MLDGKTARERSVGMQMASHDRGSGTMALVPKPVSLGLIKVTASERGNALVYTTADSESE